MHQLKHGRNFVFTHPVKSTLWLVPQAQKLSCNPAVSWGRSAACPQLSVTNNFARGQLAPLLCRHRARKKKTRTSFVLQRPKFLHDIADLAAMSLGEPIVGSHVSVLAEILEVVSNEELSVFVEEATLCTFGLVNVRLLRLHFLPNYTFGKVFFQRGTV